MAYGGSTGQGKIHFKAGRLTAAQVNAGTRVIPPRADKKLMIVGGQLVAIGGAAATATSVDVNDTTGTPVVGVAVACTAMTENTQMDFDAASNVTRTTYRAPFAAGKGIQVIKGGSDLATATHVDYYIEYVYVNL